MSMAGDNDKEKKGFSGLSGLVSEVCDIDESINPEPKTEAKASASPQPLQPQRDSASSESAKETASSPPPIETVNSGESGGGSWVKWPLGFVGIVLVCSMIFYEVQSNGKSPSNPPGYLSEEELFGSSQSNNYQRSITSPALKNQSTTPIAELQYTKPSVGTSNVLSVQEICWCIRGSIRIEAMRDVINTDDGIDEFNTIVNDYNSRCGSYRYRQGSQARAEHDIEAYRSQIVSEAIQEAKQLGGSSYPSGIPKVSTSSAPKIPRATDSGNYFDQFDEVSASSSPKDPDTLYTKEAQQLLADLGYDLGSVDGDYGRRTADAVKAFQRDAGIVQDGWIDQDLLSMLRKAKAAYKPPILSHSKHQGQEDQHQPGAPLPRTQNQKGPQYPSGQSSDVSGVSHTERSAIESYCGKYNYTPGDVNSCINREEENLRRNINPNTSGIQPSEKLEIESYCAKYNSTPGDVNSCINREAENLRRNINPNTSGIQPSEKSEIESYCGKYNSTPGDVNSCVNREAENLRRNINPDTSGIQPSEKSEIESYCAKYNSTPGDVNSCINRKVEELKRSL